MNKHRVLYQEVEDDLSVFLSGFKDLKGKTSPVNIQPEGSSYLPFNEYDKGITLGVDQYANRANNQGTLDWIGKSLYNTGIEATLGTLKAISDIPDIIGKYAIDSDNSAVAMANGSFQNDVSKYLGKLLDASKAETYSTYRNKSGWTNEFLDTLVSGIGDGSVGSAVASLIPGLAVTKGITYASKMSNSLLNMALQTVKNTNKIESLRGLNTLNQVSKFDLVAGTLAGAIYSNAWESVSSMTEVLPELKKKMTGKLNPKTGKVFTDAEINEVMKQEADNIYYNNLINVIPEAIGIHSIVKPRAGFLGKGTKDYSGKSTLDNAFITEAGTEYFQEIQNTYAEESAKRNVDIALGLKNQQYTWVENLLNPKAQASGIIGAFGATTSVTSGKGIDSLMTSAESKKVRKELLDTQKKDFEDINSFKNKLDKEFVKGEGILTLAQKTNNETLVKQAEEKLGINRAVKAMANGTFGVYLDTLDKAIQIAEAQELDTQDTKKKETLAQLATALKEQGVDLNSTTDIEATLPEEVQATYQEYKALKEEIDSTPKTEDVKVTTDKLKKLKDDAVKLEKHYIKASDKYGLQGIKAFEFAVLSSELETIDKDIEKTDTFKQGLISQDNSGLLQVNRNKDLDKIIKQKEEALAKLEAKEYDTFLGKSFGKLGKSLGFETDKAVNDSLKQLRQEIGELKLLKDVPNVSAKKQEYQDKVAKLKDKKKAWWELQSPAEIEYYYNQEIARLDDKLKATGKANLNLLDKADIIQAKKALSRNAVYNKLKQLLENKVETKEDTLVNDFYTQVDELANEQELAPLEEQRILQDLIAILDVILYADFKNIIKGQKITENLKPILLDKLNKYATETQAETTQIIQELLDEYAQETGEDVLVNASAFTKLQDINDVAMVLNEAGIYDFGLPGNIQEILTERDTTLKDINDFYQEISEYKPIAFTKKTKNQLANELLKAKVSVIETNLQSDITDLKKLMQYLKEIENIESIITNQKVYTLKPINTKIVKEKINEKIQKVKEKLQAEEKNEIEKYNNFESKIGIAGGITDLSSPVGKEDEKAQIQKDLLFNFASTIGYKADNNTPLLQLFFKMILGHPAIVNFDVDGVYELISTFEITDKLINSIKAINTTENGRLSEKAKQDLVLFLENLDLDYIKSIDFLTQYNAEVYKKVLEIEQQVYQNDFLPFPEQIIAIRSIVSLLGNRDRSVYLQGLAGTGKSSAVIKYAVEIFKELNPEVKVLAFAKGAKANEVITEVLGNKVEENLLADEDVNLLFLEGRLLNTSGNLLVVIDEAPKLTSQQVDGLKRIKEKLGDRLTLLLTGDPNQLSGANASVGNTIIQNQLPINLVTPLVSQKRTGDANVVTFQEEFIRDRTGSNIDKNFTQLSEKDSNGKVVAGVKGFKTFQDIINDIQTRTKEEQSKSVILTDNKERYQDKVSDVPIMTVEESQGLEFDNVYIDLNYDINNKNSLPFANKRMYVATSRAKKFIGITNEHLNPTFITKESIDYTPTTKDTSRFDNNRKWYNENIKKEVKPETKEEAKEEAKTETKELEETPLTKPIIEEVKEEPIPVFEEGITKEEIREIKITQENNPSNIFAVSAGIDRTQLTTGSQVWKVGKDTPDGLKTAYIAYSDSDKKYYEVGSTNEVPTGLPVFSKERLNKEGIKTDVTKLPTALVQFANSMQYQFGEERQVDEDFIQAVKTRFKQLYKKNGVEPTVTTEIIFANKQEIESNTGKYKLQKGVPYLKVTVNNTVQYIPLTPKKVSLENSPDYKLLVEEFTALFDVESGLNENFRWGNTEPSEITIGNNPVTKAELMDGLMFLCENEGNVLVDNEYNKDKNRLIEEEFSKLNEAQRKVLGTFRGKLYTEKPINGLAIGGTLLDIPVEDSIPAVTDGEKTGILPENEVKDLLNTFSETARARINQARTKGWAIVQRSNSNQDIVLRKVFDVVSNEDNTKKYHIKIDYLIDDLDKPRVTIFRLTGDKDKWERRYGKDSNVILDTTSQRNSDLLTPVDTDNSIENIGEIETAVKTLIITGEGRLGDKVRNSKHYGKLQWAFHNLVKANAKLYIDNEGGDYVSLREYDADASHRRAVSLFSKAGHRAAYTKDNELLYTKVRVDAIIKDFIANTNGTSSANNGFGIRLPITEENKSNLSNYTTRFEDIVESYISLQGETTSKQESKTESATEQKSTEISDDLFSVMPTSKDAQELSNYIEKCN
jgi:hypothetical protein